MLKVARTESGEPEIFRSIQGEGPMAGRERTFIRLSGCNLHCRWCDTAYTWNWIGTEFAHDRDRPDAPYKFDPAKEMVRLEIGEVARLVLAQEAEGVVITGGEPLMQSGDLIGLIGAVRAGRAAIIEVETNGSIAPEAPLVEQVDLFVVSPKLAHSGNDPQLALRGLADFAALPKAVFKFVARDATDVATIQDLTGRHAIESTRVYVMPEGTDSDTLRRRGRALSSAILDAGFNFSDRLHIHLFGEKRGV